MKRLRLRLRSTIIPLSSSKRPKAYLDLRHWWLHELRQIRAKRKYAGIGKKEMKAAQRALAKLREEFS